MGLWNPRVWGERFPIQLLWTTAWLLVTLVSLIYLRRRWFSLRRQMESKIPLCNSIGGILHFRNSSSYNKLLDRVPFKTLSNNLPKITWWSSSAKIANGLNTLTISAKRQMLDWIPNAPPIGGTVNVECR